MAEQPVVWNKKLLVVALILGVLAVALFYLYDSIRERQATGETIQVLHWKRDLAANATVSPADITVVAVPRSRMAAYEGALTDNDDDQALARNAHLSRDVKRTDPVRFMDLLEAQGRTSSGKIKSKMVGFPIRVDPDMTPQGFLKPNDHINLLGMVNKKGRTQVATLIQNLKVLATGGGEGEDEFSSGRKSSPSSRVYRSILVEVSPKVSEQLVELLSRVQGKLTVVLRSAMDVDDPWKGGINPELESVLQQPLPAVTPEAAGPAGPP